MMWGHPQPSSGLRATHQHAHTHTHTDFPGPLLGILSSAALQPTCQHKHTHTHLQSQQLRQHLVVWGKGQQVSSSVQRLPLRLQRALRGG